MQLLEQHSRGRLSVRVTDCGCDENCDARAVFATVHDQLWLTVGLCVEEELEAQVEFMLEDELVDEQRPSEVVDQGLALFGLTWRQLMHDSDVVVAQLKAFEKVPDWMMRVPTEQVWAARRCVFGNDLTRVPRALMAMHRAYHRDAPAAAAFAQGR